MKGDSVVWFSFCVYWDGCSVSNIYYTGMICCTDQILDIRATLNSSGKSHLLWCLILFDTVDLFDSTLWYIYIYILKSVMSNFLWCFWIRCMGNTENELRKACPSSALEGSVDVSYEFFALMAEVTGDVSLGVCLLGACGYYSSLCTAIQIFFHFSITSCSSSSSLCSPRNFTFYLGCYLYIAFLYSFFWSWKASSSVVFIPECIVWVLFSRMYFLSTVKV